MLHSRLSLKTCFLSCDANVREPFRWSVRCLLALLVGALIVPEGHAEQLRAGAAKIDISRVEDGPLESPLFAKALVMRYVLSYMHNSLLTLSQRQMFRILPNSLTRATKLALLV